MAEKKKQRVYQKTGNSRGGRTGRRKNCERGGFLSRYDLSYVGRDTVNQVGKIAPGLIKQAAAEIDIIVQNRINQVIKSGGAEVECILPKTIRAANENVYKTPFRMLGNFGKQQSNKIKKKIFR